ncbi:LAFA_0G17502g1_1 [Lachancea sp. 'fantastica']|nr:LAFA_0G17502g1_1 [Lachancea sp. 'fantastica']
MASLQQNVTHLELLVGILKQQLDAGRWPNCTARMLNSGNFTLQETPESQPFSQNSNAPAFFLHCAGDGTENMTSVYASLMQTLIADSRQALVSGGGAPTMAIGKNQFSSANLLISFAVCAVCAGSWMLLVVLLLLPANNHNSRKKMVFLGVTYSAVFHTVVLSKSMHSVFESQYNENYQNSAEFDAKIIDSTLFNVMFFFTTLISNLNWMHIVYYMFHNYQKTKRKWVPRILSNRNRQIIAVGLILTSTQAILMGLRLWAKQRCSSRLRIVLRVVDFIIYTVFTLSVSCFVWRKYGFTLRPKTFNQHLSRWEQMKSLFCDYHELVLLLAYNAGVMALLYGIRIFTSVTPQNVCKWLRCVVIFLNVLVTVNIWGLIGVLEQRERTLSKETVLGRKINNQDRFFVDPKINYDRFDSTVTENSSVHSRASSVAADSKQNRPKKGFEIITRPARAFKSRFRGGKREDVASNNKSSIRSSKDDENGSPADDTGEHCWPHDNESTETLLTRNYIFDHGEA